MADEALPLVARFGAAAPATIGAFVAAIIVFLCPPLMPVTALALPIVYLHHRRRAAASKKVAATNESWTNDELEALTHEADTDSGDFAGEYLARVKSHQPHEILTLTDVDLTAENRTWSQFLYSANESMSDSK
jgi:hypothetical protein